MAIVGVTGGAGFVGANLVIRLLNRNHVVKVIDDLSTGMEVNLKSLNVEFLENFGWITEMIQTLLILLNTMIWDCLWHILLIAILLK